MNFNRRRLTAVIMVCVAAAMLPLLSSLSRTGTVGAAASPAIAYKGPQSSFSYKKYSTHSAYKQDLRWRMGRVYEQMAAYMDDSGTVPIPGIIETYTVDGKDTAMSERYVPQGLCRVFKFWLVTAYDADKENNSVIYVIDKDTDTLISTLTLPYRYHAGGIAFDGERIWLTGSTSDNYTGYPFLHYIEYETLHEMIKDPLHEVTDDEISGKIYIRNKPSFLECENGVLWVGTYAGKKGTHEGYMYGYPVTGTGYSKLNTVMYSVITGIDSSAQGADIYGNHLYVSSSYNGYIQAVKSSFVTKYDIRDVLKGKSRMNVSKKELRRIEVPKMNEEIIVENGDIFINFESASGGWNNPVIKTDRILAIRMNLWR